VSMPTEISTRPFARAKLSGVYAAQKMLVPSAVTAQERDCGPRPELAPRKERQAGTGERGRERIPPVPRRGGSRERGAGAVARGVTAERTVTRSARRGDSPWH